MKTPRLNDAQAKRLRAQLRSQGNPCHICREPIDYDAHHLHPLSFQLDHLWQIANGGPAYEPDNTAAAHRTCNRQRSDTIDDITITTAAHYGVTLTKTPSKAAAPACAPAGQPCTRCNGTHNPRPGVTFETARDWMANA